MTVARTTSGPGRARKSPRPGGGRPKVLRGLDAADSLDRNRRLTIARRHLDAREGFERLSPKVGELDERAVEEMFGGDPDRALSLLADAARATDPRLRELARRLASRLVVDIARRGRVRRPGSG
ncbi:MAG: hypothetical protein WKF58_07660 [Ilumatobacteraceae bacterium]